MDDRKPRALHRCETRSGDNFDALVECGQPATLWRDHWVCAEHQAIFERERDGAPMGAGDYTVSVSFGGAGDSRD